MHRPIFPSAPKWLALAGLLALIPACDPCAGVSVCGEPRIDYEGQVVLHLTGRPAAGVRVEFTRTGGAELEQDVLTAVTDSAGRFRLSARAREEGVAVGRLLFVPAAPYEGLTHAVEVELGTIRAESDVRFLGSWGVGPVPVPPRIRAVGELFFRGTGEPIGGVEIEVRRTGGAEVSPASTTVRSGEDGRFVITRETVNGARSDVIGSLTVRPPAPASAFSIDSIRFDTSNLKDDLQYLGRWGVGGGLNYQGEINWVDDYSHAPGIAVEFRRTGGIVVEPDTFVVETGSDGRFTLRPKTREAGEVVADLFVRHPDPTKSFVIPGVVLATREDDESRLLGVWTIERP